MLKYCNQAANFLGDIMFGISAKVIFILGLSGTMAVAQSTQSQDLVCDVDQLSKECIECLVEVSPQEQQSICYQRELPEPMATGLDNICPKGVSAYQSVLGSVLSSIRNITVENRQLAGNLIAFQASGGDDCSLLAGAMPTAAPTSDEPEVRLEATIISDLQSCIAVDVEKLFDMTVRMGQGTSLTGPRIIALQDIDIALVDLSSAMQREVSRAESLEKQRRTLIQFCEL